MSWNRGYKSIAVAVVLSAGVAFAGGPANATPSPMSPRARVSVEQTEGHNCDPAAAESAASAPREDRPLTPQEQAHVDLLIADIDRLGAMTDEQLEEHASRSGQQDALAGIPLPGPWKIAECIIGIGLGVLGGINRDNVFYALAGMIMGCVGLPNIWGAQKAVAMAIWRNRATIAKVVRRVSPYAASLILGAPEPKKG